MPKLLRMTDGLMVTDDRSELLSTLRDIALPGGVHYSIRMNNISPAHQEVRDTSHVLLVG